MTLKELKQYSSICSEILEIKTAINENTVHDTVRGSDSTFPYVTHAMSVSGVPEAQDNTRARVRLRNLEIQKGNIERFIDGIEDSLTRRIFELRFMKGWSWVRVAHRIGGITADAARMMCNRYIDNKKENA